MCAMSISYTAVNEVMLYLACGSVGWLAAIVKDSLSDKDNDDDFP
jgi:hypothetical protein